MPPLSLAQRQAQPWAGALVPLLPLVGCLDQPFATNVDLPLQVIQLSPTDGAVGVGRDSTITATFNLPVVDALAGLRANEARYFKNKYDLTFTTEPASKAKKLVTYVANVLKQERDIVIEVVHDWAPHGADRFIKGNRGGQIGDGQVDEDHLRRGRIGHRLSPHAFPAARTLS